MSEGVHDGEVPLVRIVDDQPSVRDSIADLLASVRLRSRTFASAAEFLRVDHPGVPGCVVLDVRMPDLSGFDLLAAMRENGNRLPAIFVTGHGDVPMAVRAMKAGAVDFLAKPFDDQQLIDAVNAANRYDAARRLDAAPAGAAQRRLATLSDGERQVLELTIRGLRIKQIAAALSVSEITVKVRRARVMQKLETNSMPDLVRLYHQGTAARS